MIGTPEQDEFVTRSSRAIATTVRRDGTPASSMIGYARVGDALLFSTLINNVKGRTLSRDPRIVLCVVSAERPESFVSVEGDVRIHRDNPRALHEQMFAHWDSITEGGWPEARRKVIEELWDDPYRAIFEVTPTRVSGIVQ